MKRFKLEFVLDGLSDEQNDNLIAIIRKILTVVAKVKSYEFYMEDV